MGTREDLLVTAEALAAAAREAVRPLRAASDGVGEVPGDFHEAGMRAHAARAALHAATLVDAQPAPIIAALERFEHRLSAAGVTAGIPVALADGDPAEAIEIAGDMVEHFQREVAVGAAVQVGYVRLQELAEGLLRDFEASEAETARRIATRIQAALDESVEAIEHAKRGEA